MNHFTSYLIKSPLAVLFTGAILESDGEKWRRGAKAKRLWLRFGRGASVEAASPAPPQWQEDSKKVPFSITHAEISGSDGDRARLAEH